MKRLLLVWWVVLGMVAGGESLARAQVINEPTLLCGNNEPIEPSPCDSISRKYSLVTTVNMAWVGDGIDYATVNSDKWCTSCGGGAPKVGELPALEVHRYHRYRDLGFPSSLGPGSFTNFDVTLTLHQTPVDLANGKGNVMFLDPRNTGRRNLRVTNGQGPYLDTITSTIRSLILLDASSQLTQDHATAVSAILITHEGDRYTFEIIRTNASPLTPSRFGRLVQQSDRNGNVITLAYQFPRDATDAALGFDRRNLWKLAMVTDAYGRQAAFTYARVRKWGPWAVTRIDLPNGQHLTYTYDDPSLQGLSGVVYPDGTTTTLSTTQDAAAQMTVLHYFDAAAEGTHRKKSVYLTNPSWIDPITQQVFSQSANLARQILNGAGEVSYQITAVLDPVAKHNIYYVYDGGLSFHRFTTTPGGGPVACEQALNGNPVQHPSTFVYQLVSSYQITTFRRMIGETDILGRTTAYEPDLATGAIKKTTFPDGSWSKSTYNPFVKPMHEMDRLGRYTKHAHDLKGNRLSKTVAVGKLEQATRSSTYNARGQKTTATDANGNVTAYSYTPEGYLASMTEPPDSAGGPQAVTNYTHDGAGRLTSETDPRGRMTAYAYDARNRVTAITYNDGTVEQYVFGGGPDANLLVQKVDRLGIVEAVFYDETGRETQRTQAFGKPEAVSRSCTYLSGTELEVECFNRGERILYAYDSYNRRIGTTVQPNTTTFLTDSTVYDEARRVDHVVDRYGRKTFNVYDATNRVVRTVRETVPGAVTPPAGQALRDAFLTGLSRVFTQNAAYLIEETQYDADEQVLATIDGRGIQTTFEYDALGRTTCQIEAAGTPAEGRTEYDYDAQGNRIRVRHPRHFTEAGGFISESTYTGRHLLSSTTAAKGRTEEATESYAYDLDRKRSLRIDGRGFAWNTLWSFCCGHHQAEIEPAADVDVNALTPPTRALTVENRNSLGHVTHSWVAGDASLFPNDDSLANPANTVRETTTRYDGLYRPVARTVWLVELGAVDENAPPIAGDPGYPVAMGLTTRWVYDDDLTDGVGLDMVDAGAMAGLALGIGSDGMAVEETNPAGERKITIQDGLGRVVRVVDGNGNAATTIHDELVGGMLETLEIDALGHTKRSRADAAGNVRETIDAEGYVSLAGYDANGNKVLERDPNGVGQDCIFDERNREFFCADTQLDSTSYDYDADGNVVGIIDGIGNATTCSYDARDRKLACTNRIGGATTYTYDDNGNLLGITDAEGHVTTHGYDSRNVAVVDILPPGQQTGGSGGPNTNVRSYGYDSGRRLVNRTDQEGSITTYVYDSADRLLARGYPDGMNDTFSYDGASRMIAATSARYGNTVSRTYDAGGRLQTETLSVAGHAYIVEYLYDAANRQIGVIYPDQTLAGREYTNRELLASVNFGGSPVASFNYDSGARRTTPTIFGNGLVESRTYQLDNQIASIAVPDVIGFGYVYDENKNRLSRTNSIHASDNQTYGYDAEDRLLSFVRVSGATQSWSLSLESDWTQFNDNGNVQVREHSSAHELTQFNAAALVYDAKGNWVASNSDDHVYVWDFENRMRGVTTGGGAAAYAYDALGRRVSKSVNATTTIFVSDGLQEIAEYDSAAGVFSPDRMYIYGSSIDEPVAVVAGGQAYYYHADGVRSISAISDQAGTTVERYSYDPYGKTIVLAPDGVTVRAASIVDNAFTFTGQRVDSETGLMYYRARYYSVDQGRFIQRDPIDDTENWLNVGAYAWNVNMLPLVNEGFADARYQSQLGLYRQQEGDPASYAGINMYEYGFSRPTTVTDPLGTGMFSSFAKKLRKRMRRLRRALQHAAKQVEHAAQEVGHAAEDAAGYAIAPAYLVLAAPLEMTLSGFAAVQASLAEHGFNSFGIELDHGACTASSEKWPGGINFTRACKAHDTCCESAPPDISGHQCNKRFHNDMLVACRDATALARPSCRTLAKEYYWAVEKAGGCDTARAEAKKWSTQ